MARLVRYQVDRDIQTCECIGEAMSRLVSPGDLLCDAIGLGEHSDHRMILRMFINMVVWGALAIAGALTLLA